MAEKVLESGSCRVPLKKKMSFSDVAQLVIAKMHGVDNGEKSKEVCIRILEKRKQKWRKRHKLSPEPASQHLSTKSHKEIASRIELTETALILQVELTSKRKEALHSVRQLQIEKWDHCLEAICHRLKKAGESLLSLQSTRHPSTTVTNSLVHVDQHQIIKDLQTATVQAKALKDIQKMKLYMTPRVPFFDKHCTVQDSVPVLHDLEEAHTSDSLTDSSDNIPIAITTEVSTTSLCNDLLEAEDKHVDKSSLLTHTEDCLQDGTYSLQTCTAADDATHAFTPGISVGMEVVCVEGCSGLAIGSSSDSGADTDIVSSRDPSFSPNNNGPPPGMDQTDTLVSNSVMLGVATTKTELERTRTRASKRKKHIRSPTNSPQNSMKKPKLNRTLNTPGSPALTDTDLSNNVVCELGETDGLSNNVACELGETEGLSNNIACELGETEDLSNNVACELGETEDLSNNIACELGETEGLSNNIACETEGLSNNVACELGETEGLSNNVACELGETEGLRDDVACELGETEGLSNNVACELGETKGLTDDVACELGDPDDSDSQMSTLLQVLERTPYELRIPKRNSGGLQTYSFNKITLTSSTKLRSKRKKKGTPKVKKT